MHLTHGVWSGLMSYTILGLILDVIGVVLLSADLIRLQRAVRERSV